MKRAPSEAIMLSRAQICWCPTRPPEAFRPAGQRHRRKDSMAASRRGSTGTVTFYRSLICRLLKMAYGFFQILTGHLTGFAFQRTTDEFLGAEAHGKGQSEDDSSKQNAERKANDAAANAEMLNRDRDCKHVHEPFHTDAQKARVLQVHIDS